MDCPHCASDEKDKDFIFATPSWLVYLAFDQYYLGRSIIVAKEHRQSLSEITSAEWQDFGDLVKKLEKRFKDAFGATMFNWTCLLNNSYKKGEKGNPHVHWHFRPRYENSVTFEGMTWEDKEFGEHYARQTDKKVPEEIFEKIIEKIKG